jgi:hypothetical protein
MIRLSLRAFGRHASLTLDWREWRRPWAGVGCGAVVFECLCLRGVLCVRRQRWTE